MVKHAAGNVRDTLKIEIPEYITPSYNISALPGTLNFESKTAGYIEAPAAQAAQTVIITNTGNQTVTVTLPTSTNYTITAGTEFTENTAALEPTDTADFTVQPITRLGVGTHNETLKITGAYEVSADVALRFVVEQPTGGDSSDDGSSSTTTVSDTGKVESSVPLLAGVVSDAQGKGEAVQLPMPEVPNTTGREKAPTATVELLGGGSAKVEIPVENVTPGTSETTFSPDTAMTGGMIVTVLARMEGVDTITGDTWYEAGQQWAMENGVSDGTSMDQGLTREQLATMLWNYSGKPQASGLVGYIDAADVSDWASQAMAWCVEQGIIGGTTTITLSPQGPATRVQVATILMWFIKTGI